MKAAILLEQLPIKVPVKVRVMKNVHKTTTEIWEKGEK